MIQNNPRSISPHKRIIRANHLPNRNRNTRKRINNLVNQKDNHNTNPNLLITSRRIRLHRQRIHQNSNNRLNSRPHRLGLITRNLHRLKPNNVRHYVCHKRINMLHLIHLNITRHLLKHQRLQINENRFRTTSRRRGYRSTRGHRSSSNRSTLKLPSNTTRRSNQQRRIKGKRLAAIRRHVRTSLQNNRARRQLLLLANQEQKIMQDNRTTPETEPATTVRPKITTCTASSTSDRQPIQAY